MTTYLYLLTAIVFETIGTSALQASEQFTRPKPLLLTIACYAATFYFLSLALRTMPVGVAYAIWSGLGIVLIALIGLAWFGQKLDLPALIGLALIIAGVVVINLFSAQLPVEQQGAPLAGGPLPARIAATQGSGGWGR